MEMVNQRQTKEERRGKYRELKAAGYGVAFARRARDFPVERVAELIMRRYGAY